MIGTMDTVGGSTSKRARKNAKVANSNGEFAKHHVAHGKCTCVKRFERSNGLDTALYKNYLYLFTKN